MKRKFAIYEKDSKQLVEERKEKQKLTVDLTKANEKEEAAI